MIWFLGFLLAIVQASPNKSLLMTPDAPEMNRQAPESFHVRMETTKGVFVLEVRREWAPHGVDRFYNLVRAGYYDQSKFFRAVKGRWTQFGINGDPEISQIWRNRTIPDDPRVLSNVRGTLSFAFAVPNGRTTQVFIEMVDNSVAHDAEPFVPLGKIVEGMEVVDSLYSDYGETSGGGIRAGKQDPIFEEGNAYLLREFPKLDTLIRAVITP